LTCSDGWGCAILCQAAEAASPRLSSWPVLCPLSRADGLRQPRLAEGLVQRAVPPGPGSHDLPPFSMGAEALFPVDGVVRLGGVQHLRASALAWRGRGRPGRARAVRCRDG
jgi:hypothetical protein